MNILFIKIFFVGFMVSEIPRVSVFGYFLLYKSEYILCIWVYQHISFLSSSMAYTIYIKVGNGTILMWPILVMVF